jgi:nicotinate-nucleotide adenylyltransferase
MRRWRVSVRSRASGSRALGPSSTFTDRQVRLGIFGGSFDPPHIGHLLVAIDAIERLALDQLFLVPAALQPLKAQGSAATAGDRLEMLGRLADCHPSIAVDPIEIDRGGLSYTVETLAAFADRFPQAERYFLVGTDVLATFERWREPDRVLELASVAVLQRGETEELPAGLVGVPSRRVDVSSTEIRQRVRAGLTIRGFVPDAVAEYIAARRLYQ